MNSQFTQPLHWRRTRLGCPAHFGGRQNTHVVLNLADATSYWCWALLMWADQGCCRKPQSKVLPRADHCVISTGCLFVYLFISVCLSLEVRQNLGNTLWVMETRSVERVVSGFVLWLRIPLLSLRISPVEDLIDLLPIQVKKVHITQNFKCKFKLHKNINVNDH